MISKKDIAEIRKILAKSERPLIFYDDDTDGVCSYLLMSKYLDRGKGLPLKSSPMLTKDFMYKVRENSPDLIIVLDKPLIDQDFIDEANVPILWIDHHPPVKREYVKYYNPQLRKKDDNKPTSYLCYKITENNLWLGFLGTLADWNLPKDITKEFLKEYPDLMPGNVKDPGHAMFGTEIGKLVRVFNFAIMGMTSDAIKYTNVLRKIESPYELLRNETPRAKFVNKKCNKLLTVYNNFLQEAIGSAEDGKYIIYTYASTKYSFTGELSNELMHRFPGRLILVGRIKGDRVIISMRSHDHNLPKLIKNALEDVEGYGGGHIAACGGNIAKRDFSKFTEKIKEKI
ncbi:hypothetical protein J4468_01685 [Candidatus Woesearchaeota archaeon]|nr:hypothetical protein [Candidatus Woesearchaeota archaeon]